MYSLHTHDDYSNASLSFADSSMKLSEMIKRGKEVGLKGICLTNHETTSNFVKITQAQKDNPDFKIISGNEVYLLTEKQLELAKEGYDSATMSFFHFILIATNKQGNDMLKQLSTIAWENNSFVARGLMRRPTTFENLKQVIGDDKGCLIGSTACLGSYIGKKSLEILRNPDKKPQLMKHIEIYLKMLIDILGEDNLYLEMQPPFNKESSPEQVFMNEIILELSNLYNLPYIFTSDAHYLKKEDLKLHSAFLNSKETDDRETESFYKTTYLMGESEMRDYFKPFLTTEQIDFGINNTDIIGDRCEIYDLFHTQVIPKIQLDNNWTVDKTFFPNLEYTQMTLNSNYEQDKYLMYKIQQGIIKLIKEEDYAETFQRVEQELVEFWEVSSKLNDRLHGYFIAMSKIVELIWTEGNSLVGVGRGSAGASMIVYLLEITSLNPLKQVVPLPFYRFVDRSKIALSDIDIDLEPLKKQKIYKALSDYFKSLGGEMVLCATFGTLASRSALATAGRGLGINNDIMDSITSLIPSERGQLYSLSDCLYGNEEKHRSPVPRFSELINEYDDLLETALKIEGLIISRGLHASGVFCTSEPIVKYCAKMRSPKGVICTQFDLHDAEYSSLIKYDLLFTSASSKIRNTLDTLIENNYIEQKDSLKETYLSVLDPVKLDYDKPHIWESVANNEVVDLFQFNTPVAMNAVSKIKPKSLIELTQANSLMRLQQQENATESPVETYVRFKNNIKEWYAEMETWKVPSKDQRILEKVLLIYNGVADTQECLMELVQIKELTGFTIAEADLLRKAIGKKSAKVMEQVKNLFYLKGSENNVSNYTLDYIWNVQIMRQAGYAFSIIHCISYSTIALQELVLFHNFPSIYWQTACLNVNAEAVNEEDIESANKSVDYGKIGVAIANMQKEGIKVYPPYINETNFSFVPDEENNQIIYGLKGVAGIGDDIVKHIIQNQPYNSLDDFITKTELSKTQIINLIKAGAFEKIESKPRQELLRDYLSTIAETKNKLTMQNIPLLLEQNLIQNEKTKLFKFRKYIFNKKFFYKNDDTFKTKKHYKLDTLAIDYFNSNVIQDLKEDQDYYYTEDGSIAIVDKQFDKYYKQQMEELVVVLNSPDLLQKVNDNIINELYQKHGSGSLAKWEFDTLTYYFNEHELSNIQTEEYSIVDFFSLPESPDVLSYSQYKGRRFPQFELSRIVGTVVEKNKDKHTVNLLTPTGVVLVKFDKFTFAKYDKRLSVVNPDGSKSVVEESWFKRGRLLILTGHRDDDRFRCKTYKKSVFQYKVGLITNICEDGSIQIQTERKD